MVERTDKYLSLLIESLAIINLRGFFAKLYFDLCIVHLIYIIIQGSPSTYEWKLELGKEIAIYSYRHLIKLLSDLA